jgi:hypothetical protein
MEREEDEIEVTAASKDAWDAAITSFAQLRSKLRELEVHSHAAADAPAQTFDIAGEDVVDFATMRPRDR